MVEAAAAPEAMEAMEDVAEEAVALEDMAATEEPAASEAMEDVAEEHAAEATEAAVA